MNYPAALQTQDHCSHELRSRLAELEGGVFGASARTQELLLDLRRTAEAQCQPAALAYTQCLLGECSFYLDDHEEAQRRATAALHLARTLPWPELESRCLNGLGLICSHLGETELALDHFASSLRLAVDLEDEVERCRVLLSMAQLYCRLGQPRQALDLGQQALVAAECLEHPLLTAGAHSLLASLLSDLELAEDSLIHIDEVLSLCAQHDLGRLEGRVRTHQAAACLALGRLTDGLDAAQAGLDLTRAHQDVGALGRGLEVLGRLQLQRGEDAQAEATLREGLELVRRRSDLACEIRILGQLSALYEAREEPGQALHWVRAQQQAERRRQTQEQRTRLLSSQVRLEMMRREAELEKQRTCELARANSALRRTRVALTRFASQDQLSGVANRAFFLQRVQRALKHLTPGWSVGLISIDFDHLRAVNDHFGHLAGDHLIATLARRMQATVRGGDLVGRLSGDEFMVLLTDLCSPDDIDFVAEKLLRVLREPVEFREQLINPSLSLGCVVAPQDGTGLDTLHKYADLALAHAKAQGGNMAVRFAAHMSAEEQERRQLEQDLRRAIQLGQLELHYQGQFLLPAQRLSGFEALVRWRHPELGLIPPDRFIPLAEESRLILDLGDWVLREACRQAQVWQLPLRQLTMAVNVSARQFEQQEFVAGVRRCLQEFGLPGTALVLELTESLVHHDPQRASASIEELQAMGVKIAMDDFGTGYSSLSMLKNLPFEQLKIDREFLQDLTHASEQFAASQQFIETIVSLAHNLQMRVVAEGVETAEQYDLLCSMGCDEAQGYWLARPLPPAGAAALLPADTAARQEQWPEPGPLSFPGRRLKPFI